MTVRIERDSEGGQGRPFETEKGGYFAAPHRVGNVT